MPPPWKNLSQGISVNKRERETETVREKIQIAEAINMDDIHPDASKPSRN